MLMNCVCCSSTEFDEDSDIDMQLLTSLLTHMKETPVLAVKMCCFLGKPQYLSTILERELPTGNENEASKFDKITESTQTDLLSSISSLDPLSIAIINSHKDIVTLILEQTPVNILSIDAETGNTYIHLACRKTDDVYILESLLKKLRSVLKKEEIAAFLDLRNSEESTAIDYCSSKAKIGMNMILGGFVESSQQIIDIPEYLVEEEYEFCGAKIASDKRFLEGLPDPEK